MSDTIIRIDYSGKYDYFSYQVWVEGLSCYFTYGGLETLEEVIITSLFDAGASQ